MSATQLKKGQFLTSILIEAVTENEVENAISKLEENISCGFDRISPKIVGISLHIVKPLTYIFNQSFLNGSIPALVTSTFKVNNKEQIIVY